MATTSSFDYDKFNSKCTNKGKCIERFQNLFNTGKKYSFIQVVILINEYKTECLKNKNTKKLIWNAFDWVKTNDAFSDLRQKGMILAFDVKKKLIDDMFAKKLFYLGYENNIFVRPINNTVYFMPPYIIS